MAKIILLIEVRMEVIKMAGKRDWRKGLKIVGKVATFVALIVTGILEMGKKD